MELQNQPGAAQKNGVAKENNKAPQNGEAKKTNDALPAKEIAANAQNGKAETEQAKPYPANEAAKQGTPEPAKAGTPTADTPKPPEEVKIIKPVLNLAGTLKVVEDLHRRSIQRVNLISRIKQLETFEIQLAAEHDELEENPYQGCRLIIEDDKRRQFVTTTPGLIRLVSQFIFNACNEKLAEIEAHIVLPIL